ncbi:MAG: type II secretion system F family protein [Lachnospiraceae bacterium]|nr:type II secretion system F family protein [Lachnospiraceae bacterium]
MILYYCCGMILTAYAALFLWARGGFTRAGEKLLQRMPGLVPAVSREAMALALKIFLAADLLAAAVTFAAQANDTAAKGYLVREEYGGTEETADLILSTPEEETEMSLTVEARSLSEAEIDAFFKEAESNIKTKVFGGKKLSHIDTDLELISEMEGNPVRISWMTDRPDVIDWDGFNLYEKPSASEETSADAIPGIPVLLTAELTCENRTLEKEYPLTVYPRIMTGDEAKTREAMRTIREQNSSSELRVDLPETIGGEDASWRSRQDNTGVSLLFLGALIAVGYVYSRFHAAELLENAREEEMKRDYPGIVTKLVLLLSAGMSLRKAFFRIRKDYRQALAAGAKQRAGYEELVLMTQEMERGISEIQAYENLGKRARCSAYRTFSTLLVQNLMKGGSDMAKILEREADEAFEERKKRARVLGEEAGTKLLLPMLMMLGVVMAVLMVPAMFAFF